MPFVSCDHLHTLLAEISLGPVADMGPLLELLTPCWDEFRGSGDRAMATYKLRRVERASWNPPTLTFVIERHGGTVMGSSRAELQQWTLDLDAMTAKCEEVGHRQLAPMQPRLDVGPLADEIARLIVSKSGDARLRWYPDRRVRVLIGKIIPAGSAVRQTLEGWRRRFRTALGERLTGLG